MQTPPTRTEHDPLKVNGKSRPDNKSESSQTIKSTQKIYRILVIDDEETFCQMLVEILRPFRYEVITCSHGQEAVQYYRESWKKIDLVILDMRIPGMSGYDAFVTMHRANPQIKAIVVTGHALDNEVRKILASGVLYVLQKPFNPLTLLQRIREVFSFEDAKPDCDGEGDTSETTKLPVLNKTELKTIPVICSWCKNIFNMSKWEVELSERVTPTYGICPNCLKENQK